MCSTGRWRSTTKMRCARGALVLEIGWQQREAVSALLEANGWADIGCIQDFGGNDRCVIAYRAK